MNTRGFEARKNGDVGELWIYEEIGGGFFGEGVTAKGIRDALAELGPVALDIYLNSPGGDVFEAQAIHSQLTRHKARKVMHVDGVAASAASLILMAGDERMIADGAMVMIHEPWGMAMGPAVEMRRMADTLDKLSGQYAAEYARGTGLEVEALLAMMADETWMTAAEAVEQGFAHAISERVSAQASAVLKSFDMSRYGFRKAPGAAEPAAEEELPIAAQMIRPERDRRMRAVAEQAMRLRPWRLKSPATGDAAGP